MDHTSPSLLQRLQQTKSEAAWTCFIDLYTPLIHHWLRQRCRLDANDADDLTQIVLGVLVEELPRFEHNGRVGAFRNWIKTITIYRLQHFWRSRQARPEGEKEIAELLDQWADPNGELSVQWEREHDQFVLTRAMQLIEPEFQPQTWQAFYRTAIEGRTPGDVAEQLGLTSNAVHIAKSRVLARLRQELAGLTQI